MSNIFNEYSVNGVGPYEITFEYQSQEDVDVLLYNTTTELYELQSNTTWSFVNESFVQLSQSPGSDYNKVKVQRTTDVNPMRATFYPGSAIRAQDLNENFEQLQFAIEEGTGGGTAGDLSGVWDKTDDTITEAQQKDGTVNSKLDDAHIFTAGAISARNDAYIRDAVPPTLTYEQAGKIWNDTDALKDYFWDPDNDVWVSFTKSGPKGDKGDPADLSLIPIASASQLGVVRVGNNLNINSSTGVLDAVIPSGLEYRGLWGDAVNPPTPVQNGYFWFWNGGNSSTLGANWGAASGTVINDGDEILYNGTQFDILAQGSGGIQGVTGTSPVIVDSVTNPSQPDISVRVAADTGGNVYVSGVMSAADKEKLDGITAGAEPNVPPIYQNLGYTTAASQGTVTIDQGGTNAVIPSATVSLAGLMSASDKQTLDNLVGNTGITQAAADLRYLKLDGTNDPLTGDISFGGNVELTTGQLTLPGGGGANQALTKTEIETLISSGSGNVTVNLNYLSDYNNAGEIQNTAGSSAFIPIATNSVAGLLTGVEKQQIATITNKLDSVNLSYVANGNNAGAVRSTADNSEAQIPIVTTSVAGLMTGSDKQTLDTLAANTGAVTTSLPLADLNNNIYLNYGSGLDLNVTHLEAKIGNGLGFDGNNAIQAALGNGLGFDGTNAIQADLGSGLEFSGSNIQAKLGTGMTFDTNGGIVVDEPAAVIKTFPPLVVKDSNSLTRTGQSGNSSAFFDDGTWFGQFDIPDGANGFSLNFRVKCWLNATANQAVGTNYAAHWVQEMGAEFEFTGTGTANGALTPTGESGNVTLPGFSLVPVSGTNQGGFVYRLLEGTFSGTGARTIGWKCSAKFTQASQSSTFETRWSSFQMMVFPYAT
jgi:hypothetical protein